MGIWNDNDKEPWENFEENILSNPEFNKPLSDFEVQELETKIFKDPEFVLKDSGIKSFIDKFVNDNIRMIIFYNMINDVKLTTRIMPDILGKMFEKVDTLQKPVNMNQFIIFGALKSGQIYNKSSKEVFVEKFNDQRKYYAEKGEIELVQFFGYVCAGICIWNNFYKKNKSFCDKPRMDYYKKHREEFIDCWSEQNDDMINFIVVDQAELIVNDDSIKTDKDIKWD